MKGKRLERILAIISLILVVTAGALGLRREAREVHHYLNGIIPEGHYAIAFGGERFAIYDADSLSPDSYLINESSPAYGGEMLVSVLIDTSGVILDLRVARHRETPSFMEKIERKALRKSLIGKSYDDPFVIGADVDVVSGATYTSQAIISCAQKGSGSIARDQLSLKVTEPEAPHLEIGIPEIALLVLYLLALIGIYKMKRFKKAMRWITMLGGLFILGFWFSVPLTLSKLNTFLMGYLPDWHTQLYWYLIIAGFMLSIFLTRKNIYCNWICPLGGLQECLGVVGGAKPRFSSRFNKSMKWVQRGVALLAILLALYFRNPVQLNYEIFGVAMSLTGATNLFILTGFFIVISVFIKRSWCTYLCPIVPVEDMLRLLGPKKKA